MTNEHNPGKSPRPTSGGAAPGKPQGKSAARATGKPFAKAGGKPAGKPFAKPGEKSAASKPFGKPGDKSAASKPFGKPGDKSAASKPFGKPGDKSASGRPFSKPGDKPASGRPFSKPGDRPTSGRPTTKPGDKPASSRPYSKPGDKPAASPSDRKPYVKTSGAPARNRRPSDVATVDADDLKIGDAVIITIKRLGINGEGVGYYRKKAMFIDGALPGEVVRARVTKVEPKHAYATAFATEKPSPDRIQPFCEWYDACGGCSVQHLSYEAQLREKEALVREAFERYTDIAPDALPLKPILGMDEPRAYRNKAQLQLGIGSDKQVLAGLYSPGTRTLVDITGCPVQNSTVNETMNIVKSIIATLGLPIADPKLFGTVMNAAPEDGEYAARAGANAKHTTSTAATEARGPRRAPSALRSVVARAAHGTEHIQLTFVTTGAELPSERALVRDIQRKLPQVVSIAHNVNQDNTPLIFGEKTRIVWGAERMQERLGTLTFELSPRAFFQLNPSQTVRLYDRAKAAAALTGAETVVDAYCGVGTISLWLAAAAKEVRGIEAVPEAVEDARRNARANHIDNAEFYAGLSEELLPRWAESGYRPDVVVVDPPRSGCDRKLLDALVATKPTRIVYVSCNPSTLAKDVAVLLASGRYRLASVEPVDMFPHTAHVECVALLVRKE